MVCRNCSDITPVTDPCIDPGVVNRIEAGVSPVNRIKERQDVNAGEQPLELVS